MTESNSPQRLRVTFDGGPRNGETEHLLRADFPVLALGGRYDLLTGRGVGSGGIPEITDGSAKWTQTESLKELYREQVIAEENMGW